MTTPTITVPFGNQLTLDELKDAEIIRLRKHISELETAAAEVGPGAYERGYAVRSQIAREDECEAVAATIERCAQVAESFKVSYAKEIIVDPEVIAAAIRKLKDQP